jgi:hypothetical protein
MGSDNKTQVEDAESELERYQTMQISIASNLSSWVNILHDISQKMHHQLLGNLDTLEHIENQEDQSNSSSDRKVFRKENLNALMKNPIKASIGRIDGLRKTIKELELKINSVNNNQRGSHGS